MKRLLPEVADNNFHGPKIAFYFFIFFMVVNTVRSSIHFLADDAGLNSIANIMIFEGEPDPNKVIYLFGSLWGEVQVLLCLIFWIVFFRYKSLIPLMYLVSLLEWSMRLIIIKPMKGLDDIYTNGFTPGSELAPVAVLLLIIFFILSLKNSK